MRLVITLFVLLDVHFTATITFYLVRSRAHLIAATSWDLARSMSARLSRGGWRGVLVEPLQDYFDQLKRT